MPQKIFYAINYAEPSRVESSRVESSRVELSVLDLSIPVKSLSLIV